MRLGPLVARLGNAAKTWIDAPGHCGKGANADKKGPHRDSPGCQCPVRVRLGPADRVSAARVRLLHAWTAAATGCAAAFLRAMRLPSRNCGCF